MSDDLMKSNIVKKNLKNYLDFPKPGIIFRDIFSVLNNPEAFKALHDLIISHCSQYASKIQAVCALDARGFLFGPLIALHLQVPFVPIRKKGKLPGEVSSVTYNLEYGSSCLEIQANAFNQGASVILVDDLLATGGSLAAGCHLINSLNAKVDHCLVIIELEALEGRKKIPCSVHSLIKI